MHPSEQLPFRKRYNLTKEVTSAGLGAAGGEAAAGIVITLHDGNVGNYSNGLTGYYKTQIGANEDMHQELSYVKSAKERRIVAHFLKNDKHALEQGLHTQLREDPPAPTFSAEVKEGIYGGLGLLGVVIAIALRIKQNRKHAHSMLIENELEQIKQGLEA